MSGTDVIHITARFISGLFCHIVSYLPDRTTSYGIPGIRSLSHATQLLLAVGALGALKALSTRGSRRTTLRRRRAVLSKVMAAVRKWEDACIIEILMDCGTANCTARTAALTDIMGSKGRAEAAVERWAAVSREMFSAWTANRGRSSAHSGNNRSGEAGTNVGSSRVFHGITSSVAFATDFDLCEYLQLSEAAAYILTLPHDREWATRLALIARYAVFRWLALMEEVRVHTRLYRQYILGPSSPFSTLLCLKRQAGSERTQLGAWREYGRPAWLLPHSTGRGYLCLPLSYYPVESILTYMAEFRWLNADILPLELLKRWSRDAHRLLFEMPSTAKPFSLSEAPSISNQQSERLQEEHVRASCISRFNNAERYDVVQQLVALWTLRYTGLMVNEHFMNVRHDTRRYIVQQFYRNMRVRDGNDRSDQQRARRFRLNVVIFAFTECVTTWLQVVLPKFSFPMISESIATAIVQSVSISRAGAEVELTSGANSSSSSRTTPITTDADALVTALVYRIVLGSLATTISTALDNATSFARRELGAVLSENVTQSVREMLLSADEAFLMRLFGRPGSTAGGGAFSDFSGADITVSIHQAKTYGEVSGRQFVSALRTDIRYWATYGCLAALAIARKDWNGVAASYIIFLMREDCLLSSASVALGLSPPLHVSRYVSGMGHNWGARRNNQNDEKTTATGLHGIGLLLDILAEDLALQQTTSTTESAKRSCSLQYPFLSLVVCSGCAGSANVAFDTVCRGGSSDSTQDIDAVTLLSRASRIETLYTTAAAYTFFCNDNCAKEWLASLKTDVEAALMIDVTPSREALEDHLFCSAAAANKKEGPNSNGEASAGALLDAELDPEEVAVLQSAHLLRYLGETTATDFETLFSAPYRLVLRLLGLEVAFAVRAANVSEEQSQQRVLEQLGDIFDDALFNPFAFALRECLYVMEACVMVLVACGEWRGWSAMPSASTLGSDAGKVTVMCALRLRPVPVARVFDVSNRIRGYVRAHANVAESAHEVRWRPLRRVMQLCTCVPATLADSSALSVAPQVCARRARWAAQQGEEVIRGLHFDAYGRVVGGLRLHRGIRCEHVNFAYTQLHHHTGSGSSSTAAEGVTSDATASCALDVCRSRQVRLTLSDVSLVLPADGMTGIIGRSGAGKSSLMRLLRREYDPLAVVNVDWRSSQRGGGDEEEWCEELLALAMWLQYVAHTIPLHVAENEAEASSTALRVYLEGSPGCIYFDSIPAACLSASYLRQWLSALEQSPHMEPSLSFAEAVGSRSLFTTCRDVQCAMELCECNQIIAKKREASLGALSIQDCLGDVRVGELSKGEAQRVALAAVVAAACGRARVERSSSIYNYGDDFITAAVPDGSSDAEKVGLPPPACGGLLLDEPTSSLDAFNELKIQAAIEALLPSVTCGAQRGYPLGKLPALMVVIIAHRLSTLRAASHLVVLEAGKVVAQGTQEEVQEKSAIAREMFLLQSLD